MSNTIHTAVVRVAQRCLDMRHYPMVYEGIGITRHYFEEIWTSLNKIEAYLKDQNPKEKKRRDELKCLISYLQTPQ